MIQFHPIVKFNLFLSFAQNIIQFVTPATALKVGSLDSQGNNPNGNSSIGVGVADMIYGCIKHKITNYKEFNKV